MAFISLENVTKEYGQSPRTVRALSNVSITIGQGEFVAITGPSGCGKTTLLSILGAMSSPTEGRVEINGVDLYQLSSDKLADFRSQNIGFVFQQLHLIPYLTAMENVMLPLTIIRSSSKRELAQKALEAMGLSNKEKRLPGELSGGEQARVGIARALVREAPLILADEPTGNLDSRTGEGVIQLLHSVNERGHTIVMVTHSPQAAREANRIVSMVDGQVVSLV